MSKKAKKKEELISVNEDIDYRINNIDVQVEEIIKEVGTESLNFCIDHPAVVAAVDGKRGISAAYIASIVSALVAYEQSNGWKHLIAALNLLVRFVRWARKNRKQEGK